MEIGGLPGNMGSESAKSFYKQTLIQSGMSWPDLKGDII